MTEEATNSISAGGKETAFPLVLGLDTFGDRTNTATGQPLSHAQTIRNVVEEGVLAEQVGVDFFGIGEHHTDYFPMPAGDVVLASIAARTEDLDSITRSFTRLVEDSLKATEHRARQIGSVLACRPNPAGGTAN